MSNINKQALTDEAISKAFAGTNFGRDDFKNILAETVIDAAAGWRCGYTATTICTQLGLLTPKGCASALGLRFISEHVQRETKRLKDELESAEKRIAELESREVVIRQFDEFSICHFGGSEDYAKGYIDCQKNYNKALGAASILVSIKGE
ncbi:hypothetical protein [Leclercia adecarboxylata]|uniref:hypothetical protein n=1 Tax=Leclercia adecarboxylata TaxID=83655 RepID=UPI00124EBFFE|nr:hypothetical protein [Leclercia adecarboxylata]QFH50470.1 hypothetical protein FR819_14765 [Leclercia adecarboxylata]